MDSHLLPDAAVESEEEDNHLHKSALDREEDEYTQVKSKSIDN